MRLWLLAAVAVLWLVVPTEGEAAAGSGARPSEDWSEMQKLEYYIGQIGGALSICGYHSLSRDLTELAQLSPYGRKGLASIRVYDSIKGGYCGKLAADGEKLVADRDQLYAYLTNRYNCPGGQCVPEGGDDSTDAPCRAEAEEHLKSLPLEENDIRSIHMRRGSFASSQVSSGRWGSEAWVRLDSCAGWLIIEMTESCYPRQAFTRGDCEVEGVSSY